MNNEATHKSFYPPSRCLMGPGPTDINPRVLAAMSRATLGHLDPTFIDMTEDIKQMLQKAFKTNNPFTIPLSSPASAAMEAAIINILSPGEKIIVCRNGVFGMRMTDIIERSGGQAITLDDEWGRTIDLQKVEDAGKSDAYIIACFGDPGLLAAREITDRPVLGVAEAGMHAATFVGSGFSIVTTLARTINIARHLVLLYGMSEHCRRIRASELEVLALEDPQSNAYRIILDECQKAIKEDECNAIVLGCAGMADLAKNLTAELKIPIIDGVVVAAGFAEALVRIGLKTGKQHDLAFPLSKSYSGDYSSFSPSK